MLQKIISKKVELPVIYLVEDEEDFKALPRGLPFIIAPKRDLQFVTIFLEFQTLYKSAIRTGLPLKWMNILNRIGYKSNMKKYILSSGGEYWSGSTGGREELNIDEFISDQYLVNFDRLAELKILPVWLEDIRASVEANIIDEVIFNPIAFNKQLGMNIGAADLKHNMKNLLILDISGSIPRAIAATITNLAKLMSKKFYADVILTGGKTIFLDYEEVMTSNIVDIAQTISRDNEGVMYKAIVEQPKSYGTVISFGDNDSPQGYNDCKIINPGFTVDTLYSLHTDNTTSAVTGYAKAFKPKTTHIVKDWVNTIEG